MYWNDLSEDQLKKVKDILRQDPDIITPNINGDEQDEELDDWMNRYNNTETVIETLQEAYA